MFWLLLLFQSCPEWTFWPFPLFFLVPFWCGLVAHTCKALSFARNGDSRTQGELTQESICQLGFLCREREEAGKKQKNQEIHERRVWRPLLDTPPPFLRLVGQRGRMSSCCLLINQHSSHVASRGGTWAPKDGERRQD
jgi:hypothetical protein